MTELTDLSETDADNTPITGANIAEGCPPSGINNAIRNTLGLIRRAFKTSIFRVRDATDQTKLLALDLSGLTTATTRTASMPDKNGTLAMTSDITAATSGVAQKLDVRRNRIVNHDMRASQENGTTSGTTNGYYPVDQWAQYRVTSAGTLTVAQVASVTPAGSPSRLRATVTGADASLAAGEFWTLSQKLEGSNVADFQYGGSSAKASVLRFGFKGPAGTYAAALHNSAANRSFVAVFTITAPQANTDTVQTIAITGDTSGSWLTADGEIGIALDIVLAAGATFRGAAGWQAGNILATSAISNGMGTGSAVFELFDVGLRLDPDATGVYGQYESHEVDPIYRVERYGWRAVEYPLGLAINAASLFNATQWPQPFTKAPTIGSGATYTVSTGSAGTVGFETALAANVNGAWFRNAAVNWTTNTLVRLNAFLDARLT